MFGALAAGAALSAAVELAQLFIPGRRSSVADVTFNGLGAESPLDEARAVAGRNLVLVLTITFGQRARRHPASALGGLAALAALALTPSVTGLLPTDAGPRMARVDSRSRDGGISGEAMGDYETVSFPLKHP